MLSGGSLRNKLAQGIELWDHDYNRIGLSDGSGKRLGRALPIPDDNTDPPGLLRLVSEFSGALQDDVSRFECVVLKSCFPNSRVPDRDALIEIEGVYARLRQACLTLPVKVVLLTSPPCVRLRTNEAEGAHVKELNRWLCASWPTADGVLRVVDLHAALSTDEGWLRSEFSRLNPFDCHPNRRGSVVAAEILADSLGSL